jgi:hypothetical protein
MASKPIIHHVDCMCPECHIKKELKRDYASGLPAPITATATAPTAVPSVPSVPTEVVVKPVRAALFGIGEQSITVTTLAMSEVGYE